MYKVTFYTTLDGKSPVKEFLDSCQQSLRRKILRQFAYLEEYGLNVAITDIKKVVNTQLWELRILGKDNIRLFCDKSIKGTVVILHVFRKKKQKTPVREIDIALRRSKEVLDW